MSVQPHVVDLELRDTPVTVSFYYWPAERATAECPVGSPEGVELWEVIRDGRGVLKELTDRQKRVLEEDCLDAVHRGRTKRS